MRKLLFVLALVAGAGCHQVWNGKAVRERLTPLRGQPIDQVANKLCDECELSRDRRQAICRVYAKGCKGRYSRVKLYFSDEGDLQTWQAH